MATKHEQPKAVRRRGKIEDTAQPGPSKTDRRRLDIDAWEPSLLRELLAAQDRLKTRK